MEFADVDVLLLAARVRTRLSLEGWSIVLFLGYGLFMLQCLAAMIWPKVLNITLGNAIMESVREWIQGSDPAEHGKRARIAAACLMIGFTGLYAILVMVIFGNFGKYSDTLMVAAHLREKPVPQMETLAGTVAAAAPAPTPVPTPPMNEKDIQQLLDQASQLWRSGMKQESLQAAEKALFLCNGLPEDHPTKVRVKTMIEQAKKAM